MFIDKRKGAKVEGIKHEQHRQQIESGRLGEEEIIYMERWKEDMYSDRKEGKSFYKVKIKINREVETFFWSLCRKKSMRSGITWHLSQ